MSHTTEYIWTCKIGGPAIQFQSGADAPMRQAVQAAFKQVTGNDEVFCFSGWGGELTEPERAVVENRLPSDEYEAEWNRRAAVQAAQPEAVGWLPFDRSNPPDDGLMFVAVSAPETDCDVDDYGRTVGWHTGEVEQSVALVLFSPGEHGEHCFDPVDSWNAGKVPPDGWVTHYMPLHMPKTPTLAAAPTLASAPTPEPMSAPTAEPVCQTCNGHGMIGGPSFYAPDEGGVPCPDCATPPSAATPEPSDAERAHMVLRAARELCRIHAGECQVNEQDTWNLYAEQLKRDADAVLRAATKGGKL